jgi:hypothetical protein
MSVKDLIKSAFDKDASAFETTFNSVMGEKMEAALSAKYDEMFAVEEEAELDEELLDEAEDEEDEDEEDEEDDEDEDDEEEDED